MHVYDLVSHIVQAVMFKGWIVMYLIFTFVDSENHKMLEFNIMSKFFKQQNEN